MLVVFGWCSYTVCEGEGGGRGGREGGRERERERGGGGERMPL